MRNLLVVLILLVGCGPQFRTNYQFQPPATQQGQACVFQCENSRLQCQRLDDLEYERCQDRAEDRYVRCEDRNRYRSNDDKEYCYR